MKIISASEIEENLKLFPQDCGCVILMRHTLRDEIIYPEIYGFDIDITEQGKEEAKKMGNLLKNKITKVRHSPLKRCRQTVECILEKHLYFPKNSIAESELIGAKSSYFLDLEKVAIFLRKHKSSVRSINSFLKSEKLDGFNNVQLGSKILLKELLPEKIAQGEVHLFVTHDSVIAPLVAFLENQEQIVEDDWPRILEFVTLWIEDGQLFYIWRGKKKAATHVTTF